MADALDLGSSVAIRVGSSPTSPTNYFKTAERRFYFWGTFHLIAKWIDGVRQYNQEYSADHIGCIEVLKCRA